MATAQRPVFGPNDFNLASGGLEPGLGDEVEAQIRASRGDVGPIEEPPDKAALRKQAAELSAKAKQLSAVERELEKERATHLADLDAREADLRQREELLQAQLKALEG